MICKFCGQPKDCEILHTIDHTELPICRDCIEDPYQGHMVRLSEQMSRRWAI